MRSITATMHITLDGVVQGLGRADEDTRGGFTHGGWGHRFHDDVIAREMGAGMARPGDMLLGRRTWQDFAQVWGRATDGNPYSAHMNSTTKYVVSQTLDDVDGWQSSVLLRGVEGVRVLLADPGPRPVDHRQRVPGTGAARGRADRPVHAADHARSRWAAERGCSRARRR